MNRRQGVRFALLVATVLAAGAPVLLLAGPWLPLPGRGPVGGPTGFAGLLTTTCALALVISWAWLALGTVAVAASTLRTPRSSSPARPVRWVPTTLRLVVPVLVGATVVAAPSTASPGPGAGTGDASPASTATGGTGSSWVGLPLPDRVVTAGHRQPTVVVRPGDSLWRITARQLPSTAPARVVDRGWRRLARANAARVPDPHLIVPGTRLRLPPLTTHSREEAR